MRVEYIKDDRKRFLDLLLLADEQEDMIDKYLNRGDMFALYDDDLKGICVVTREEDRIYELKNIATYEKYHGKGYRKKIIQYIFEYYKEKCDVMYVGTGDSPLTLPFYKKCGFIESHIVNKFFIDNYDHPIFEGGKQLVDMIYLKKEL